MSAQHRIRVAALAFSAALLGAVDGGVVRDCGSVEDEACAVGGVDPASLLQVPRGPPSKLASPKPMRSVRLTPDFDQRCEGSLAALRSRRAASPVSPSAMPKVKAALSSKGFGGKCIGTKVACDSQTKGLVESKKMKQHALWYNMPPQDLDTLTKFHGELTDLELPAYLKNLTYETVTIAEGPAHKIARMMYEATKVDGVSEHLPRELRGVYWMKGNPIPEELMVIQHAQWFEDEGLLVLPMAPFSWAWPGGKPKNAPSDFYSEDREAGLSQLETLVLGLGAISSKFQSCKEGREHSTLPKVCDARCKDDLAYGYMQVHQLGNLTEASDFGPLLGILSEIPELQGASGAWTLQKKPHTEGGTVFRRVIQWGVEKSCAFFEAGSYDLVKVIDADGKFVQPWYDEFIEYIGDTPLMAWTGWRDAEHRGFHAEILKHVVDGIQDGKYERPMPILQC